MKRVAVVGNGNVASHLIKELQIVNSTYIFVGGYARNRKDEIYYNELTQLPSADIYIVAVSDDAITEVTEKLSHTINNNSIVVHTSAAKPLEEISNKICRRGVLYPLQTFSSSVDINLKKIPFFVESEKREDLETISDLARYLGSSATATGREQREKIHLAATFACNFTNHLLYISQQILKSADLPTSIITPLIEETVRKAINSKDIKLSQTGAAVREDFGTIKKHETMLLESDKWLQIYKDITNSIIETK